MRIKEGLFILILAGCAQFQEVIRPDSSASTREKRVPVREKETPLTKDEVIETDLGGMKKPEAPSLQPKPEIHKKYYRVKKGDTLLQIANKHRVTLEQLKKLNKIDNPRALKIGRNLLIAVIKEKPVLLPELPPAEAPAPPPPDEDGTEEESTAISEKITQKENEEDPAPREVSEPAETRARPRFIWPVEGGRVSSPFGFRHGRSHDGVDIVVPVGSRVVAAADGKVIYTGLMKGYGKLVIIKHSKNLFTAYAHLKEIKAKKGASIKKGKIVGLVGRTGRATRPLLHFEVRHRTESKNPLLYLPKLANDADKGEDYEGDDSTHP